MLRTRETHCTSSSTRRGIKRRVRLAPKRPRCSTELFRFATSRAQNSQVNVFDFENVCRPSDACAVGAQELRAIKSFKQKEKPPPRRRPRPSHPSSSTDILNGPFFPAGSVKSRKKHPGTSFLSHQLGSCRPQVGADASEVTDKEGLARPSSRGKLRLVRLVRLPASPEVHPCRVNGQRFRLRRVDETNRAKDGSGGELALSLAGPRRSRGAFGLGQRAPRTCARAAGALARAAAARRRCRTAEIRGRVLEREGAGGEGGGAAGRGRPRRCDRHGSGSSAMRREVGRG